jgi:hypothetical protein
MQIVSTEYWQLYTTSVKNLSPDVPKKDMVCYGKVVKTQGMEDEVEDDVEQAGLGLFERKVEGAPRAPDKMKLGGTSRFQASGFAKKVSVTHETLRSLKKFKQALQIAKRLYAAAWQTKDLDAAGLFLNATTAASTGGYDHVCLASTAHVLPGGAHANNILGSDVDGSAIGMSPSVAAIQAMRAMATRMPAASGLTERRKLKGLVFPDGMLDLFQVITGTQRDVGNPNNDLNTVAKYGLDLHPVHHFDAVNPNLWGALTDADNGLQIRTREDVGTNTWVAEDEMSAFTGAYYADAQGWSDWRCWIHGAG